MKLALILGLALVAVAHAKCPNSCSGHGTCSKGDICTCYNEKTEMYAIEGSSTLGGIVSATGTNTNEMAAWTGADCSLRTCPRGMSWNAAATYHDCLTGVCDGAFYGGIGGVHLLTHTGALSQENGQVFRQIVSSCTDAGTSCVAPTAILDVDATAPASAAQHRMTVTDTGTNGWTNDISHTVNGLGVTVSAIVLVAAMAPGDICTFSPSGAKYAMDARAVSADGTTSVTVTGRLISTAGVVLEATFGTTGDSTATCACAAGSCTMTFDNSNAAKSPAQNLVAIDFNSDATTYAPATDGYASGTTNSVQTNLALQNTGKTDHNDNVECSDAGLCDRSSGVCQCFDGYEGSSCQRTECPNDCSNQGTCMPNTLFATDAGVRYSGAWDSGKHYGCKCDAGFRGADCSLKECPSFTDPMYASTHSDNGNTVGRDCSGRGLCEIGRASCRERV